MKTSVFLDILRDKSPEIIFEGARKAALAEAVGSLGEMAEIQKNILKASRVRMVAIAEEYPNSLGYAMGRYWYYE